MELARNSDEGDGKKKGGVAVEMTGCAEMRDGEARVSTVGTPKVSTSTGRFKEFRGRQDGRNCLIVPSIR